MIPIRDVFPFGSPNSPFGPVFTGTLAAGQSVIINDANFPGLGRFLPCWVLIGAALTSDFAVVADVGGVEVNLVAPLQRGGGCFAADGVSLAIVTRGIPVNVDVVPLRASLHLISMEDRSIYRDRVAIAANPGRTVNEDEFSALKPFSWGLSAVSTDMAAWQFTTTTGAVTRTGPPGIVPLDGSTAATANILISFIRANISHTMPRARVIGGEAGSLLGPLITGPSIAAGASLVLTEATVPALRFPGWYLPVSPSAALVLEFTPDAGATWRLVNDLQSVTTVYLIPGIFRIRNTHATSAFAPQFLRVWLT